MTNASILALKNEVKEFSLRELSFRPISNFDIETLRLWRNKEENRTKFIYDGIISPEQQINWYESYKIKNNDLMFIVSESNSGALFATVSLYNIDFTNLSAEFGRIMIGDDDYKGKGLGAKITSAIVNYAFEELNLKNVYLEVFSDNLSAIKTYEKAGFKFESESRIDNRLITKMVIIKK